MPEQVIYTGQNVGKDCLVGNKAMNRYGVFNGLERVRRIDSDLNVTILGVGVAANPTAAADAGAGNLDVGWYAWRAVYASATYTRPVANLDGSGNYTRGNPSANSIALNVAANRQVNVTVPCTNQSGITHVLLYRSLMSGTQAAAQAGPFYYVAQGLNEGATVTILDNVNDAAVGLEVEVDNYPPNAYRYAIEANNYVFAGGNFPVGTYSTCTVTPGSSAVTIDGEFIYDGVIGWRFKCVDDSVGGVDEAGLYFANYVDPSTIQLVDADGNPVNYNGSLSGSGQVFALYLPGYVLRWCKFGEPEAWPLGNLINFEGDITGIATMPNQPILVVCTDKPRIYTLDLTLIGSTAFSTNRALISTEYTVSSHYSLKAVEGRLRAIDAHSSCIIEIDSVAARDISRFTIPRIFEYLCSDLGEIRNWHCAYDQRQHLFGAFVTLQNAHRTIDFCIGQHTITGGWFYHLEKDLLCTGDYQDPTTGELMVLGGTQGLDPDGAVWGRIWTPNVYSEWIPEGSLLSGTITAVIDDRTFEVDTSSNTLAMSGNRLIGRWVLVCDANGENAQLAYIQSNTENRIVVDSVMNGLDPTRFSPSPGVGWRFYLGLIECRWGPKKFDFGDPDVLKKIWEVWCCVSAHNESDLPFVRLYRGFERNYDSQLRLSERIYLDNTVNQSLVNKVDQKMEPVPRWGVAWFDRSYGPTTLHSLTIVFNPMQEMIK